MNQCQAPRCDVHQHAVQLGPLRQQVKFPNHVLGILEVGQDLAHEIRLLGCTDLEADGSLRQQLLERPDFQEECLDVTAVLTTTACGSFRYYGMD